MDILLVEDNELNRDMLSRRLERKGFSVRHAEDGEQALNEVDRAIPALILLDMNLPVMDGWETSMAIREKHADKNIRTDSTRYDWRSRKSDASRLR